jgi:DNA-directed RNA polymerase specialized sigma24 family protein
MINLSYAALALYRDHHPSLRAYVRRRIDDPRTVEDLCQQAWLGLYEKTSCSLAEPISNPRGYLINLAKYLIKSHYREKQRLLPLAIKDEAIIEIETIYWPRTCKIAAMSISKWTYAQPSK